jgi:hypothetical protein
MGGIQEWLSFYFKAPQVAPGLYPEHDLFIQHTKLKNTLRWMMGEDQITHLGVEYYRCGRHRAGRDDRRRGVRRARPAAAAAGSWLLLGLAIAALVAYANATSSAQLAALYPEAGGTYVYARERLGPTGGSWPAGASWSARPPAWPRWRSPSVPTSTRTWPARSASRRRRRWRRSTTSGWRRPPG